MQLYEGWMIGLTHLKNKKQDILIFSESAAGSCWVALTEIRKIIIKNGFKNQEEEIDFLNILNQKYMECTCIISICFR